MSAGRISPARTGMGRRGAGGQSGVTLIELLVAILAFSIIMLALMMLFTSAVKIWLYGSSNSQMIQNARVVLARIGEDLRSAAPPYQEIPNLRFQGLDQGSTVMTNSVGDEINFHIFSWNSQETNPSSSTHSRSGDLVERSYFLKDDATLGLRIQYRKGNYYDDDYPIPDDNISSLDNNQPFAFQISSFNVQYYDAGGATWYDTWDSKPGATAGGYDDNQLPDLVRVTITAEDDSNQVGDKIFTIVVRPACNASALRPSI